MAKRNASDYIPAGTSAVLINPSFLFKPDELFIQRTFIVRAKKRYEISEKEAECLFALSLFVNRTIVYVRNSGTPPGLPVYTNAAEAGEITLYKASK